MKIERNYAPPAAGMSTAKAPNASAGDSARTDEVRLSAAAGTLKSGSEAPPINATRIAEIKQAISEGRFQINADAIADRLLDSARELLGNPRR